MTKQKDEVKLPISAAPVAIATHVDPSREVALKGRTASRLEPQVKTAKPEKSADITIPFVEIDGEKKTDAEVFFERWNLTALRKSVAALWDNSDDLTAKSVMQWVKDNVNEVGDDFDPEDGIDNAYVAFRRSHSTDREITSGYERTVQAPFIYNPTIPSHQGRDKTAPTAVIDDGFKAPAFKLDKKQARTELAADIRTVSEMYAAEAGMSPKDFAKVMGGIATIESRFGVLREVKGTKYPSSAGGAYHYLNGTIADEVRKGMSDPRIADRVAKLGVDIKDGVAKSEAWTLKDDNILAGGILARRIVATARANPELKDDIEALTTRVYQSHNLGDAGARALARGGRQALEAIDKRADDNNPLFFGGNASDAEINGRYKKFVTGAIKSSDTFIAAAFDNKDATATMAAAKPNGNKPTVVAAAKIDLPERAPS